MPSSVHGEVGLRTKLRKIQFRMRKKKVGRTRQHIPQTTPAHHSDDIPVSDVSSSSDKHALNSAVVSSVPISPPPTDHKTESPTSTSLLSRLHALLPSATNPNTHHIDTPPIPPPPPPKRCQSIKVRIVSWNMHDGFPSGDLEQLLGEIPPYHPTPVHGARQIPDLGENDAHPYHILVVAGQECPSVSGLPMAFGAGYKIYEKDKKPHSKKTDGKHNSSASLQLQTEISPILPFSPDPSSVSGLNHSNSTSDITPTTHNTPHPGGWSYLLDDWLVHGNKTPRRKHNSAELYSMFSEGGDKLRHEPPSSSKPQSDIHNEDPDANSAAASPFDRKDLMSRRTTEPVGESLVSGVRRRRGTTLTRGPDGSSAPARAGPYELAAKERMMGIYLAVYVHRDVKPLIRGIDRDSVAAGLIGGRVGNKGGVAISLNFDGTTFLFVNAHLAAHGSRTQARMANLCKIKAELSLEHFLSSEDPRIFAEEITDRYDHSFVFGDLNFRLDVSRLHADWLIGRKEYSHALTFDQLLTLMKKGEFPGFREAPIDFPPTFKYDIDLGDKFRKKTVRRAIKKLSKERRALRESRKGVSYNACRDDESAVLEGNEVEVPEAEAEVEIEGEGDDHTSFASTRLAALSCTDDAESSSSSGDDEDTVDDVNISSAPVVAKNTVRDTRGECATASYDVIDSVQHHPMPFKAKTKWRTFLSAVKDDDSSPPVKAGDVVWQPNSPPKRGSAPPFSLLGEPGLPTDMLSRYKAANGKVPDCLIRSKSASTPPAIAIDPPTDSTPAASTPDLPATVSGTPSTGKPSLRPAYTKRPGSYSISIANGTSAEQSPRKSNRSNKNSDEETGDVPRPGRYDTSSKKRVPSWCDRIIFKTTVIPPLDEENSAGLPDKTRGSRGRLFGPLMLFTGFARPHRQRISTKGSPTTGLPRAESLPDTPTMASPAQMKPPSIRPVRSLPLARAVISNASIVQEGSPKPKPKRACSFPRPRINRSRSSSSSLISEPDARASNLLEASPLIGSTSSNHISFAPSIPSPSTSPVVVTASPVAQAPEGVSPLPSNNRSPSARRWFPFPHSFLPSSGGASSSNVPTQNTPPKNRKKKGDVECLFYGTLDDQGMAKLRGKSDHRPVIGVYSIAI